MTDRSRGRPKGSTNKKPASAAAGKAKKQHQQHHLSPSLQAQESLAGFVDYAAKPRAAAVAATSRLNTSPGPATKAPASDGPASPVAGKGKGAKRGRPRSIFTSPEESSSGGGSSGGGASEGASNGAKKRKVAPGVVGASYRDAKGGNGNNDDGDDDSSGDEEEMSGTAPPGKKRQLSFGRSVDATDVEVATTGKKKGRGRGRPPAAANAAAKAAAAAAAALSNGHNAGGGKAGSGEEDEEEEEEVAVKKSHKKSHKKKQPSAAAAAAGREGSRTQPRRGSRVDGAPAPPSAGGGRGLTGYTGVASSYPKRIRNAPDVFKAEPSSKPMMPSKPTTPARGGSGKPGATSSEKVKPTSHKKGAAAAAAAASKAKAKVKVKSPAVKKKPAKPAPPPPPPPPPPPYRFEYEGWSVVGGRELVAVGMFLYASAPIMKFGRGFEVNMQAMEEALSSERPSESELLSLVHSRLLCTRRELKGLKPGEMKYPFSWCMERLRERLADWYRRRAVLRELIFEAERSDDEEEISAAGGAAGGGVTIQQKQKQKQQRTAGATLAKAVVGGAQPAAAARVPLPLQQHAAARVEGKGAAGSEAQVADGQEGKSINGSGAPQGGLPNGVKVDPMDVVEEVAAAAGGTGTAVGATLASPKQQQQQQQSSGGGVEESKGGEEPGAEAVVPAQERGAVSKEEEAWDVSKRVSATQCKVCNTRGTVTDMVKCIYEGCGGKYHLRCLLPVVDEVPKGQWYCPDCREKKRVFGCNGCMQNDRPSKILQCDGPKCGLEYHYGCLEPPLDKVPTTKWWYCPDCVRTDNQVGCRVCKNDVDYDKLLKCDGPGCELEWHTYCLKPPIKIIPKGDFFCPYCKAKQKVEFEKKRQQDIARANERRRRREARKARMAVGDPDDDTRMAYERREAAGLRGALLAQYEDLDPDNLRLELHRINILLTRIEEAREASDALAAAAAAAGGGGADGDSAGVNAVAQADPESGADLASGAGGEGEVQAGVAGDGSPKETGGGVTEAGGAAKSSPDGGDVGEQAAAAAAAAAAGAGAGADTNGTDREASTVSVVVSAAKDENGNSGAGGSGNQGEASAVAGGSGGGNGGGDGGGGGETVPNETDPVAAFWAALAAAESAPTEGSGDDGEADQEEEDAQRKQQQQRLEEEEEVDGAWGGAGDSPLAKGRTYESLSVPMRVAILNALCEEYMDDENFRLRIIDETNPDFLRRSPFGFDSSGRLYYHFPIFRKEMRVYRTVEKDSPIPPVDKVATELTGGGTLEAAAEAAAERKAAIVKGGSEMELVADSLEGMERLLTALSKSKSKSKKDDAILHENLTVEVEEMRTWVNERMEKEEKKRLADEARERRQLALEAAPRRRSGRLVRAAEGWAVAAIEGGQGEEDGDEEEEGQEDAEGEGVQPPPNSDAGHRSGDGGGNGGESEGNLGGSGNNDYRSTAVGSIDSNGELAPPLAEDSAPSPMDTINTTGDEEGGQVGAEEGGVAGDGSDDPETGTLAEEEPTVEGASAEEGGTAAAPESNDSAVGTQGGSNPPGIAASDDHTAETSPPSLGKELGSGDKPSGHEEAAEEVAKAEAETGAADGADGSSNGGGGGTYGGTNGNAEGASGVGGGNSGATASVGERSGGDQAPATTAAAGAVPEVPPAATGAGVPAVADAGPTGDALENEAAAAAATADAAPSPAPAAPSSPPPSSSLPKEEEEEGPPRLADDAVGGVGDATPRAEITAAAAAAVGALADARVVSVLPNGGNGKKSESPIISNGGGGAGDGSSGGEEPLPEQAAAAAGGGSADGGTAAAEAEAALAVQEDGPVADKEKQPEPAVKKRKREDEGAPEERERVPEAKRQEMSIDNGGGASSISQPMVENGHTLSPAPAPAAVDSSPAVGTPPLHGLASNGALDIMALAASSRPRATTPSSSKQNSPSRDRSGSGSSGGGPAHHPVSPRGVSSALDIMAAAVEGRTPVPLLYAGSQSGGVRTGASDGDSPAQRSAK